MNWFKLASPLFGALRAVPFERSAHGLLGGICAGVSEKFGTNVWIVRAVAVAASFLPVVGIGLYAAAWALLPDRLGKIHAEEWLRDASTKA
ncbi:PspC domain-containing protein [Falsarthrobacter nasiphocae]|uniref:Phage shock protein PspC (Stress-responsive transcriptional regulator) n=1 Tax=Falsarthrobacter nasiphocae TaxID=189863 RepID=A0AAE3YFJ2_9MICC|nr:PspC domain-containing protein [Falsarthrobacter nasiphocae]MDR6892499.1 phage shock protein PspC (stress-responsive transcriptional regulator) [Falsarthrobacter nasiphocae]